MTKVSDISVITDAAKNFANVYRVRHGNSKLVTIEKQLLLTTVIFGLLFVIFSTLFFVTYHYYAKLVKNRVCNSKECIETAMTLLQTIDVRQDPCEDFYKFACGRFPVDHPLSEGSLQNSWFAEKEKQLNRMIQDILTSPISPSDLAITRQTKEFYQSCLNNTELNELGLDPLYEILDRLELPISVPNNQSAGNFNLGRTLALAQRYLSQDILVSLSIAKETKNFTNGSNPNEIYVFKLSPGITTLVSFNDWNLGTDLFPKFFGVGRKQKAHLAQSVLKRMRPAMVKFMAAVIQKISDDLSEDDAVDNYNVSQYFHTAEKMINFTMMLMNVSLEGSDDDSGVFSHRMNTKSTNLTNLENTINEKNFNASASNTIDWREYFSVLLEGLNNTYAIDNETILIDDIEYFKTLAQILRNATAETIQRHIWWKVVEKYAQYTTPDMREVYLSYYRALGEITLEPRPSICTKIMKATMGVVLSHEMSRNNNFTKTFEKVLEMLKDIRAVFEAMVNSTSWMDAPTKLVTLDKAKAVMNEIGYVNWMTDPEKIVQHYNGLNLKESEFLLNLVRVSEWELKKVLANLGSNAKNSTKIFWSWFIDPLEVNAYYVHEANIIFIPVGILGPPFYFRGLESMNYGAIGTILGHELTHGFDIRGKNYNKFGEQQENLWPNEIVSRYEAKAKCFVDQYENYTIYDNKRLNGTYTLAENIADNGGIRESYRAYKLYLARYGQEPKLPGFENFTHEQLFFLSYANMWCETVNPKLYTISSDTHSPQRIRVLVTLQNMKEFSEAYNCPKTAFMNPMKKCIIW